MTSPFVLLEKTDDVLGCEAAFKQFYTDLGEVEDKINEEN